MQKTLKDRIALKIASGTVENSSLTNMRDEMDWVQHHKNHISFLLEFEGKTKARIVELREVILNNLILETVEIRYIGNSNPFAFLLHTSEYDPFNHLLIGSDYLNYLSAIRAQHHSPVDFGAEETWLIWNTDGESVYRFLARGSLAALRQNYPDLVTWTIVRDAGVDIRLMQHPKMIMRLA